MITTHLLQGYDPGQDGVVGARARQQRLTLRLGHCASLHQPREPIRRRERCEARGHGRVEQDMEQPKVTVHFVEEPHRVVGVRPVFVALCCGGHDEAQLIDTTLHTPRHLRSGSGSRTGSVLIWECCQVRAASAAMMSGSIAPGRPTARARTPSIEGCVVCEANKDSF